jgi:hypothetical protein
MIFEEIHDYIFAYIVIVHGMANVNQHKNSASGDSKGPRTFITPVFSDCPPCYERRNFQQLCCHRDCSPCRAIQTSAVSEELTANELTSTGDAQTPKTTDICRTLRGSHVGSISDMGYETPLISPDFSIMVSKLSSRAGPALSGCPLGRFNLPYSQHHHVARQQMARRQYPQICFDPNLIRANSG